MGNGKNVSNGSTGSFENSCVAFTLHTVPSLP